MFPKKAEPVLVLLGLLHFIFFSRRFSFLDEKSIKAFQFRKLKKLLCTTYDEISYYKTKFDKAGFNPHSDFNCLTDFDKVPVLTKQEAREHRDLLVNRSRSRWALEFKTSGSTGNPFSALVSPQHWIIEQSVVWRHWSWAGYKFRDKIAIIRSFVPPNEKDLVKKDKLRNFIYYSPFHLDDKNIEKYFISFCDLKVKFLRGYPSSIKALAEFVARNPKVRLPKLKGILTASERLAENDRRFIEKHLKAKVFNHYGLAEQIVMFGSCEQGTHMHNYEEYGYLELDGDNQILGTNLHNIAMPLIRYETGDMAMISSHACECGRTQISPKISNVRGRLDSVIELIDGTKMPLTNFYTMFEYYDSEIKQWQMVQTKYDHLEVRLNLHSGVNRQSVIQRLMEDINSRLTQRMRVDFKTDCKLIQVGEGKLNPFIKRIED